MRSSVPNPSHRYLPRDAIAGGVDLRILPLGDSITWGQYSSDGNGYRLALYETLSAKFNITFIGREHSGTMANNANEGHPGFPIGPVGQTGKPDYALHPNVVLLMAGTNDVVFNINLDTAPNTMGNVIDDIVSSCPDAALLVAEITPLLDPDRETNRKTFNTALKDVVAARSSGAKQVALATMDRFTTQHLNVTDGIHPNDEGYKQIAEVWYDAIVAASEKGWIKAPTPTGAQSPAARPIISYSDVDDALFPARIAVYVVIVVLVVLVARRGLTVLLRKHGIGRTT